MKARDELGWRYEFLQALDGTDSFLSLCKWLSCIGFYGSLPSSFAPLFAGADLFAIPKSPSASSSYRPIAVSLCIRRVIGQGLLEAVGSQTLASFFSPFQFGVGIKNGIESLAWSLKLQLESHLPNYVVWQHDAKNAFNCISRNAIHAELESHFPQLLPFFDLCYECEGQLRVWREDSNVFNGSHPLKVHSKVTLSVLFSSV